MKGTLLGSPAGAASRVAWRLRHLNTMLEAAAREVFEVMLHSPLQHQSDGDPPLVAGLTVILGLSGKLRGVLAMHAAAETACRMATLLLGSGTEMFDDRVLDAVGEVTNMVAGSFKNKIGMAEECSVSVPTVISGSDYRLHSASRMQHSELAVSFEGSPVWFTLDLRP